MTDRNKSRSPAVPTTTRHFRTAQEHVDAVLDMPSQYDRFHAALAAMRRERAPSPPVYETLADEFSGADHMDDKGNIYRRVAMSVYLSETYTAAQANDIRTIIEEHAANKSYQELTVIQSTSAPSQDENGLWKIDMIISTDMDYNKAKTVHRALSEELGQKTDGGLFTDEEKLIDWVVGHQIKSRLEKVLSEKGYEDIALDVEKLSATEQKLQNANQEPSSQTGSSMDFII